MEISDFYVTVDNRVYRCSYVEDLADVWRELVALPKKPRWGLCDAETTGLHLKKDKPFMAAIGWTGRLFSFPTTKENCRAIPHIMNHIGMWYNHNINFDIHMFANMAEDDQYAWRFKRYGDTMGLCRLTFEAVSVSDGGDNLQLKSIGDKYVDPTVSKYKKEVLRWLAQKKTADRKILSALLKPHAWNITRLEDAMDSGKEPIPKEILEVFGEWRNAYPDPGYQDVPPEIMVPYACVDCCIVDILVEKALPVVYYKKQEHIMSNEWDCLPVTWYAERRGIKVDREYLIEAHDKMETLIGKLQAKMHKMAGRVFTVGQHKVIKEIYAERTGETPSSTDKKYLKYMADGGDELAALISRLRRLEKWFSVYIVKILENSEYDGRFYTQMGQFNPVTGRFSGDAQQFPKDGIYDDDGVEIFKSRRVFLMRGFYLDFSQVELRVQAHYTLYYGGDINLCRAYMPFKCKHYVTGETYDYRSVEGRGRWKEMKQGAPVHTVHWEKMLKEGWSVWVADGAPWIPTDVHGATTEKALRIMGFVPEEMPDDDFAWWRQIGKRFNFMRNYGGGDAKAAETLDITLDAAKSMNQGYTDAFPVVVDYQKGVSKSMGHSGYVANMSGRRYYISESWKFYKATNYLIQGSCADDLKKKMVKIHRFITENNLKLRFVLSVHDELQFEVNDPAEDWAIWEIKKIMEDAPEFLVPIVAEVEFSDTNWAAKKKVLEAVA